MATADHQTERAFQKQPTIFLNNKARALGIGKKKKERNELKKKVQELAKKRQAYINEETKKRNLDASKGFDRVIQKMLREQAARKNFKFEDEEKE